MIALIGDLHFGLKTFNKTVLNLQLDFFEKQFFPFILEKQIKDVICLGDLAHNRSTIDLWVLNEIKRRFLKWFDDNEVTLHCIVGNHDTYYKTSIEPNFFSSNMIGDGVLFRNTKVYSETTIVKIGKYKIGFVPWVIDHKNFVLPSGVDVIVGHFDVKGFPMTRGVLSAEGFDKTFFGDTLVFSGHYHIRSRIGDIHYIGAPYQMSWGDFDEDRGFAVIGDNFDVEYIDNEVNPKFVKIYYREGDDKKYTLRVGGIEKNKRKILSLEESIRIAENHLVRIIIERSINSVRFDDFFKLISDHSIGSFKIEVIHVDEIIDDSTYEISGGSLIEEGDVRDTMRQFIEATVFDSMDKDLILSIADSLYLKAEEMKTDIQMEL